MRKILILISLLFAGTAMQAQEVKLDTTEMKRPAFFLNDYSLLGIHYGVTLVNTSFNPIRDTEFFLEPQTFGISYTLYGKMLGYLPYFGFRLGFFYGREGYQFKEDKETKITPTLEGATKVVMKSFDVPLQAIMHYDTEFFKAFASVGPYAGWRWDIHRTGPRVTEGLEDSFKDTDIRRDFGLKGGVGFGIVFDPFEFHIEGQVKWAWSSLYEPDWYSPYYYRFAYPLDLVITAGIHYQLSRRTGRTRKELRKEAYNSIYGNTDSTSR